jgi:hypothetical protein
LDSSWEILCTDLWTVKLPFPLTIKFKSMLQAGVATRDMDPRWMSSISWYFLCIFGLQSVFNFLLGSDNGMFLTLFYDKLSFQD